MGQLSIRRIALGIALVVGAGTVGATVSGIAGAAAAGPPDVSYEALGQPAGADEVLLRERVELARITGERHGGDNPTGERAGSPPGRPDASLPTAAAVALIAVVVAPLVGRRHAIALRAPPAPGYVDVT